MASQGTLDPFHSIETLGKLEIYDPNLSVNNLACGFCHDPAAGFGNGASILSVYTGASNPESVPITVFGAYPNQRIAKRNPQSYNYSPYFPPLQFNATQGGFLRRQMGNRLAVRINFPGNAAQISSIPAGAIHPPARLEPHQSDPRATGRR